MKLIKLFRMPISISLIVFTLLYPVFAAEKLTLEKVHCMAIKNSKQIELATSDLKEAKKEFERISAEQLLNTSIFIYKEAELKYALCQAEFDRIKQEALLDVDNKYFNLLLKQENLKVFKQALRTARDNFHLASLQYRKGLLAEIDFADFKRQLAKAETDYAIMQNNANLASETLALTVGLTDLEGFKLIDCLEPTKVFTIPKINTEEIIQYQSSVREIANDMEILSLRLKYSTEMNISPLGIQELEMKLEQRQAQFVLKKQDEELKLKQFETDIKNSVESLESTKADLEFEAKNYNITYLRYKKGLVTPRVVNEALNDFINAKLKKTEAVINYYLSIQKYRNFCGSEEDIKVDIDHAITK